MKIAIMQPYLFPYIGYFQLINKVDKFIIYDDVNYMKQSWVNRNRILVNGRDHFFMIQLEKASSFKLISETRIKYDPVFLVKILRTIKQNYLKAPYFSDVFPIVEEVFLSIEHERSISKVSYLSLRNICNYLGIESIFEFSSVKYSFTKGLERKQRLIEILNLKKSKHYYNLSGGKILYTKKEFSREGINIYFLKNKEYKYKQFKNDFVPGLSIIDVLMFNSKKNILQMLNDCDFE